MRKQPHRLLIAIIFGGLIAATIDIGAACLISGRSVPFILRTIAGGILGPKTYSGGTATALLGRLLQEFMGLFIAAIYVIASQPLAVLARRWVAAGLLYGVVIFFSDELRLGRAALGPGSTDAHLSASKFVLNLAAMLLFGLIVAYFVMRRSWARADGLTRPASAA